MYVSLPLCACVRVCVCMCVFLCVCVCACACVRACVSRCCLLLSSERSHAAIKVVGHGGVDSKVIALDNHAP